VFFRPHRFSAEELAPLRATVSLTLDGGPYQCALRDVSQSGVGFLWPQEVALRLGKPQTAGSDAHMPLEVGRYGTLFEKDLESEEDMLRELGAGRFQPARRGMLAGQYEVLGEAEAIAEK